MKKPRLISGIQPTGKLHLGNYLGALKNFVDLQNSGKYECFFFVADYHALTADFAFREKHRLIMELAADYLAAGLDSEKSIIFIQSAISAHPELAWIFNAMTPIGELSRMTQFKEKSEEQRNNVNVGLFTYPDLMAADILLYDVQFVPVGEDQLQHLELARTLARKFNSRFGKTFVEPKALMTEVPRLMSLDDPAKKMSKSRPAGCLFLNDSPEAAREKIKRAVTDSGKEIKYDSANKPAISNLLRIYSVLSGEPVQKIESRFKNSGYAEFKNKLADEFVKHFEPFQERRRKIGKNPAALQRALGAGAAKANKIASSKLNEVKKKLGLIY